MFGNLSLLPAVSRSITGQVAENSRFKHIIGG